MKQHIIDGFSIKLNDEHMLDVYQSKLPMYDRFVPYLGIIADMFSNGGNESIVVDIGANVGDTVAGFIRHTRANVICVEPTDKFYDLCKENIANFGEEYSKRISLVQAYISSDMDINYISDVSQGTAKKIEITETAGGGVSYLYNPIFT